MAVLAPSWRHLDSIWESSGLHIGRCLIDFGSQPGAMLATFSFNMWGRCGTPFWSFKGCWGSTKRKELLIPNKSNPKGNHLHYISCKRHRLELNLSFQDYLTKLPLGDQMLHALGWPYIFLTWLLKGTQGHVLTCHFSTLNKKKAINGSKTCSNRSKTALKTIPGRTGFDPRSMARFGQS